MTTHRVKINVDQEKLNTHTLVVLVLKTLNTAEVSWIIESVSTK